MYTTCSPTKRKKKDERSKDDNQLVTSAKENARLFNAQFVSVFSPLTQEMDFHQSAMTWTMPNKGICKERVRKQLINLQLNKEAEPDGISPRVLQRLANVLAAPLATLFQLSLHKAVAPTN